MRFLPTPLLLCSLMLFCGLSGSVSPLFAAGGDLFKTECASCHALSDNGSGGVGPALINIVGRPAANQPIFEYSKSLLNQASQGLVWDKKTLDQFLKSPAVVVPGTKMNYSGLGSENDRAALIAWLADPDAMAAATENQAAPAVSPEVEEILALAADPDYGEYLAAECATCHGDTASGGVPAIKGLPKDYFLQALLDYKQGVRDNSVMKLMVENLGNDELAALAAYFAQSH